MFCTVSSLSRYFLCTIALVLLFSWVGSRLNNLEARQQGFGAIGLNAHSPQLCIALVVRSFAGDRGRFDQNLGASLKAFFDARAAALHFVLDDDNSSRAWAEDLRKAFPFALYTFAAEPALNILDASPYASKGNSTRYSSRGYTRQLYDTFFLDNLLPLNPKCGGDEIVALIDADAMLYGIFPPLHLFETGMNVVEVIITKAPDVWRGDAVFLKEETPYDSMGTDVFPEFFWRSTFAAVRAHIEKAHDAQSFDDAWLQVFKVQVTGDALFLSSSNVIANFGIIHEPERYTIRLQGQDDVHPQYGSNRPTHADFCKGCCWTFKMDPCSSRGSFPNFYEAIARQLETMPSDDLGKMKAQCVALCP
jgi:hypothetical protein